ncbi:thioredoxin-like protein [Aspergillus tetrazonus]
MESESDFYTFAPLDQAGKPFPLETLKGKVVLIVNTALKCGFTPQYEGLEALYRELSAEYPERFTILGFPCNQFGEQEPGSEDEIQQFCVLNFGVTFPCSEKLMKNNQGLLEDAEIQWNFEKTLISGTGEIVGRWRSQTTPESLKEVIRGEVFKTSGI